MVFITEKKTVAFQVMSDVKAQWHVGHHAVQVRIEANWAQEEPAARMTHIRYVPGKW